MSDYTRFCEDVLVAVADEQEPPGLGIVSIEAVCMRAGIPAERTWLELVSSDLERQGYGKDFSGKGESDFLISGAGLRRADEIRQARTPSPIRKRIEKANWQMWAVVVAAVALVAYVVVEVIKS